MFTGRYPHSNGLMGLAHLGWEYHVNERTLPMLLAEAGYHSVLVGLQHESSDPSTLGYDEVVDLNADHQYAPVVAELAVVRLRELAARDRPFFLTVGMFEPHRPFPPELYPSVPPETVDVPAHLPDNALVRADLAAFYGAIEVADRATGRILDAIDELGLRHDTVVVFTTDHGIPFPGAKSTLHDAGVGVALLVRTPAGSAGRSSRLVSHVDLVPTLLDLVGLPKPDSLQGESFVDELAEAAGGSPRTAVYSEKNWHDPDQYDPVRSVRTERYRLIESFEPRPAWPIPGDIGASDSVRGLPAEALQVVRPRVELYDVSVDPARAGQPGRRPQPRRRAERPPAAVAGLADRHGRSAAGRSDPVAAGTGSLPAAIRGRADPVPLAFRQKGRTPSPDTGPPS